MKRSTLVAGLVLVLLAGYLYWLDREGGEEEGAERVFDVDTDDIVRVEIRRDGETVVVERNENTWRLRSPREAEAEADEREVDLLLENIATMRVARSISLEAPEGDSAAEDGPGRLKEFGLDTPRLEVRFETRDGAEQGIAFGKDTLTPSSQYAARLDRTGVLVLASYLANNFDKSAWDLRDKRIFRAPEDAKPKRITVTRPEVTIDVVREAGRFWVEAPRVRADRFEVETLASRFRRAEMVAMEAEEATDLEPYGLDSPTVRIRIELDAPDAAPLELEIGEQTGIDHYARVPSRPQVFRIESGLVEEIPETPRDVWSRNIFDASAYQITALEIDGRRIEKTDDTWTASGETLDADAVEALLSKLTSATAEDFVKEPPALELQRTIAIRTEETEERIGVSSAPDGAVYVQRDGDEVALTLAPETWEEIDSLLALEPDKDREKTKS